MPRRSQLRGPAIIALLATTLAAATPPASLTGNLHLDSAPPVAWAMHVETATDDQPILLTATARAAGLDLRVTATPDAATGRLRWRITKGSIDPAAWWPALRARAGLDTVLAGWGAGGRLTLSGEGTWNEGRPAGAVALAWDDGTLFNDELGIDLRAITARLHSEDLTSIALPAGQRVTIGQANVSGITVNDLALEFARSTDGTIHLARATAKIFGGEASLDPLDINPATPVLHAAVNLTDISLFELVTFIPAAIASADGKLSGRGTITWDLGSRLPEKFHLHIDRSDNARLSLAAKPGFLSSSVSPRLALLPPSWGPLARLFNPRNPARAPLVEIEMGRTALTVDALDITLTPDTPGDHRSARVSLKTRPATPGVIKSLSIDININGSLREVISLGLDDRLQTTTP